MIKKFSLKFTNKQIKEIYKKVKNFPWVEMYNNKDWKSGTNLGYMKKLSKYWTNKFKWRKQEKEINKFSNFKTKVDDISIHFIYEKGSGTNSTPLLLMHGWPGSIIEFLPVIEKLAHPEKYGGDVNDSFDVIVPSLPGFGFSGKPTRPIGPRKIASIMNKLMVKNLKYKSYLAQGGDWGATIACWLGYDHSKYCMGIHINCLTMRHPKGPQTMQEKKWQIEFNNDQIMQDGYRTQQATKPQTLSYAMMDSPVGTAAWIIEKMHAWSDLKKNDIESVYSKDILLTNIMIYLLTKTFNTSTWIYYGRREEGGRFFPKKFHKIKIPTAIALFPAEMSKWPPRSYVKRIFNIRQWNKMKKGGHFASLEQPDLLVKDIFSFKKKCF